MVGPGCICDFFFRNPRAFIVEYKVVVENSTVPDVTILCPEALLESQEGCSNAV